MTKHQNDYKAIWEENKTHLLNFIKTKVKDFDTAEDILQEVGIKLYKNLTEKPVIKNPKTWLFQVARNTVVDHYRKEKKHLYKTDEPALIDLASEISEPCVCDLSGYVIQEYMSEEYGVPLYLSDIEQIPQNEIAKILNLNLATTKSRIQRARKQLKNLVSEYVDITFNDRGEIVDFQLKANCDLPEGLKNEIARINLIQ